MTEILPESPSKSGLILKTAREEMSLTLDQVANELHLRPAVVKAIEDEDYDVFTSDVFLKGYFRTYCRLVNLHEARMMELLEQQLLARKKLVEEKNNLITKQQQAKKRKKIIVTVSVFVVCLLLIAFAYQFASQYSSITTLQNESEQDDQNIDTDLENTSVSNNSELTETASENVELVETDTQLDDNPNLDNEEIIIEEQDIQVEQEAGQEVGAISEEEVSLSSSHDNVDSLVVTPAESLIESSSLSTVDTDIDMTEESTPASAPEPIDPVLIEPLVQATLQATFTGDCWFKVTDITGKTVIGDLKRAGDEVSYTGSAPFHIVIGDASTLSLIFEDSLVNLKPYTSRNGRAELTLRPSETDNEG